MTNTLRSPSKPYLPPYLINFLAILLIALLSTPVLAKSDDDIGSGVMTFKLEGHSSVIPGLPMESQATLHINGMVAVVEIEQRFQNPSDQWIEGRYLFPLPENAAVDGMEMRIGDRIIKSEIKEKQAAKQIYQQAKAEGKKAGLLEQHRPNLFSQKVANIAPHESIYVKLRYLQTVDYKNTIFSLRLPTTITPRYIPGQITHPGGEDKQEGSHTSIEQAASEAINIDDSGWGWAQANAQVPDAHLITPPMIDQQLSGDSMLSPLTLSIQLDAGLPLANIDSTYHNILVRKENQQHLIELAEGKTNMDRDFVLTWKAISQASPRAAVFSEASSLGPEIDDGMSEKTEHYSLVMLMPPAHPTNHLATIPKETIFIIDTSGSMGGTSIKQAKAGLQFALQQLSPQDRFNIIEFNSSFSALFQQPMSATQRNIAGAKRFVSGLKASGGTEMLSALQHAFKQSHKESHLKQIIFITDGSVGNESALFNSIHQALGASRLFTVGIGSAPNSYFMRKAAEFGRGSFTYIGDINEVNQKMASLFKQIDKPMMRDITIDVGDTNKSNIFPRQIPDLYDGEPLIIKLRHSEDLDRLTIKGTYQDQVWEQSLEIHPHNNHRGIAKLWAREKIESLMDEKITGTPEETIREQVLDVALKHQLMSAYTSFVAVERTVSRPADADLKKVAIPNAVAKGQQLQQVNYPQTATPLWLNIITGCLSLLALLLLRVKQRLKALFPLTRKA